jgi:hypothetical protein
LEVQFEQPVQVHTRYPITKAMTYFIPLDKTHAITRRVFAFPGLMPYTNGPINIKVQAFDDLYTATEQVTALQ